MTNSRMINPTRTVTGGAFATLRPWSGSRLGLLSIGGVVVVAGIGLNWGWLVAIGVAPLIVGMLPCAAMCALGLCMMQMGRNGSVPAPSNESAQGTGSALLSRLDIGGSSQPADPKKAE
jgi:hypothetical protein